MKYGSVCSGIEAPSVAWGDMDWEAVFFSEIARFPSAVLNYHFPSVPNYGDMNNILTNGIESTVDVLIGGTLCQSFSIAGLRKGMDDDRGNLALVFLRIVQTLRPRWVVWENVPGVLTSNEGKDFASFVGGLGQCGYGWAYRVLDAQYFGTAQQRRRVFVVGYDGSWNRAASVLFDKEAMRISAKGVRRKGKAASRRIRSIGPGLDRAFRVDALSSNSMKSKNPNSGFSKITVANTLLASGPGFGRQGGNIIINEDGTPRLMTPTEWERLQGFPEGWTDIPDWPFNKPGLEGTLHGTPDSPRYKALGNSMPVPVLRWIGERIQFVDSIK